ncbi:hypothetical protein HPT25_23720 [Bacillus sp. BRMEA1]|uniref:hypothetical protein n=1 Tax=Neobacillus endophyticus TaxID=2738405 RepID=UPI0015669308|nr:hypothetical protein [Neobacillus endophyticus]NRD80335.1 hypothetical protein [Neobacillus endophyticus]
MNIEKMKEFIAIRKDLKNAGVIGLSLYDDAIHVNHKTFGMKEIPELQLEVRVNDIESDDYPYKIFFIKDGIEIYSVLKKADLAEYPQFADVIKNNEEVSA